MMCELEERQHRHEVGTREQEQQCPHCTRSRAKRGTRLGAARSVGSATEQGYEISMRATISQSFLARHNRIRGNHIADDILRRLGSFGIASAVSPCLTQQVQPSRPDLMVESPCHVAAEHGYCIIEMTEMTDRRTEPQASSLLVRIYRENECGAIARVR